MALLCTMHTIAACNCELAGITNNGECAQTATQAAEVGQCSCKSQVTGRMCNQCIPGFFNLSAENLEGCQGEVSYGKFQYTTY